MPTTVRPDLRALVREMDDAWLEEDAAAAVAAHFAEDAVLHDMTSPDPVTGRAAIAEALAVFTTAFRPLAFESVLVSDDGETAVVEWTARGEHTGPLGEIPATGKSFEVRGVNLLRFDDNGLLASERSYWDFATMLGQLGVLDG